MNLDRDLPDALRPLAGDPVVDAARVLAALPTALPVEPPSGPPAGPPRAPPDARPAVPHAPWRRWLPWSTLALGLLIGIGTGIGIGRAAGPGPAAVPQQPATQQPTTAPPKAQPEPPPVKKPRPDLPIDPGIMSGIPNRSTDMLLVMAFGPVEIDEPVAGRQQIKAGQWETELSTLFKTTKGQVGIYVPANDARVRLDFDSEVRVDVDRLALEFGRVCVDTGQRDAHMRVQCGNVMIAFAGASGVVARAPSGIEVLALSGTIDIITPTDAARVAAHESIVIDPSRGPQAKVAVPFLAPATSWMTRMIEEGLDRGELSERVQDVFAAYEQGTFRDAARRELLKLGARCVWLLTDSVERQLATDRAYALDAAQLLARIVDYRTAAYALPLLLQDDTELRAIVFRAVRDATGTDGGTDATFWNDAPRDRRRAAVDRWRTELSR